MAHPHQRVGHLGSSSGIQQETQFSALLCSFFPFRSALSCVSDGSIVIVLATKGICRCCFLMFKILVVLLGVAMRVSDLWKSLPSLYHAVCFVLLFFFLHRLWALPLQLHDEED